MQAAGIQQHQIKRAQAVISQRDRRIAQGAAATDRNSRVHGDSSIFRPAPQIFKFRVGRASQHQQAQGRCGDNLHRQRHAVLQRAGHIQYAQGVSRQAGLANGHLHFKPSVARQRAALHALVAGVQQFHRASINTLHPAVHTQRIARRHARRYMQCHQACR